MKWIKIGAVVMLLAVIAIIVGMTIFLKTFDMNAFKDRITRQIGEEIGRDVNIEEVLFHFSVSQGTTLRINGLSVMDDPRFSIGPFVSVQAARANIDILTLVLNRQVHISEVELFVPKVNLIINPEGVFNYQELTELKGKKVSGGAAGSAQPTINRVQPTSSDKGDEMAIKDILVHSVQVKGGEVNYIDRMVQPEMNIPLQQIEMRIDNLSTRQPFPVKLSASLWSSTKNIHLDGMAKLDLDGQRCMFSDLSIESDLSDLDVDQIAAGIPAFKEAGLTGDLGGVIKLDSRELIVGSEGLTSLSADVRLTDGHAKLKAVPVPIEGMDLLAIISEDNIKIKRLIIPLASGKISGTGIVEDYLKSQTYAGNLDLNDIRIHELTANVDLPAKIEGILLGDFKVSGSGFDDQAMRSTFSGKGSIQVKDGRILNVNILRMALDKISFIPDLVAKIENNLPVKYKEKLKNKDTVLEQIEIKILLHDGVIAINQALLNADGFLISAKGQMDFDQNITLNADLYIPEELSSSMVAASEDLKFLVNDKGQIHIPFTQYRGKVARIKMVPNVGDIGKAAIKNRGKEELRKVIFDVLDLKDEPAKSGESVPEGAPKKKVPPEKEIIENILDMIPVFD